MSETAPSAPLAANPPSTPPASERREPRIGRSSSQYVFTTLAGVGLGASLLLIFVATKNPSPNSIPFELAKSLLQVLVVVVLGGVVTAVAANLQNKRATDAATLQNTRAEQAMNQTYAREQFEVRTKLLERALLCAQTMYVMSQHTLRGDKLLENIGARVPESDKALDDAYRSFSAESAAIDGELSARYGKAPRSPDEEAAPGMPAEGMPTLLWHQIRDLLTVYYFALKGTFYGNVLHSNSKSDENYHSGEDFSRMVPHTRQANPPVDDLKRVLEAVQKAYPMALPKLCEAMLREVPVLGKDSGQFSISK